MATRILSLSGSAKAATAAVAATPVAVQVARSTSSDNNVAMQTYESIGFREDTEFKNYVLPLN